MALVLVSNLGGVIKAMNCPKEGSQCICRKEGSTSCPYLILDEADALRLDRFTVIQCDWSDGDER